MKNKQTNREVCRVSQRFLRRETPRPLRLKSWLCCITLFGALAAASCSRGPTFAEVDGTVRLDSKPLEKVRVEFLPDPEKGTTGPRSTGITDSEGRFRLARDDGRSGVVVGNHVVVIHELAAGGPMARPVASEDTGSPNAPIVGVGRSPNAPALPSRVPVRYSRSARTPLNQEVKPGKQTIDLNLTAVK